MIYNTVGSARAGDIITLQGENFGNTPYVWLDAVGTTAGSGALRIVNRSGTTSLSVQIPSTATGALVLRMENGFAKTIKQTRLNAARPFNLDALQIVPGGVFRVFGRNLVHDGYSPIVKVNGALAAVNMSQSNEHVLVVTAPSSIASTGVATITVDNGNATGPTTLERTIALAPNPGADPFGLGVGWAGGFAAIAAKTVNAGGDSRLSGRMYCDGRTNDSAALQAAVVYAQRNGGGVVTIPAGTCRLQSAVQYFSNVVIQGAGKSQTILSYDADNPVYGSGVDLAGIRNLTFTNSGSSKKGPIMRWSTRVFLQNVGLNLGSSMAYLHDNANMVIAGSDFKQTGTENGSVTLHLYGSMGLTYTGNTLSYFNGVGINLDYARDFLVQSSTFNRDAARYNDTPVTHMMTVNFAHHFAVVGNTFKTVNGPVSLSRNDSEVILAEGGGAKRTENYGAVTSATSTSLTDTNNTINVSPFSAGVIPENYAVAIVAGKGAGQTRRVVGYTGKTLNIDAAWETVPDTTSRYATMVWGVDKAIFKGNQLTQNSGRGLWLYSNSTRDVDIVNNTFTENGGIMVRAAQKMSAKMLTPIFSVRIDGNTIVNSGRNYLSNIAVYTANIDGSSSMGLTHVAVEVRNNTVTANMPNLTTNFLGPVGNEGYFNQLNAENRDYVSGGAARLTSTVLQRNTCNNCDVAVRLGTGANATVVNGLILSNSVKAWSNTNTTYTGTEAAIGTVVE